MKRHAKAVSAGTNQGTGIRCALFGRSFATRGASPRAEGSGAPSHAHALPRAINRPLALAGLLLALAFTLALAASPAHAAYVQTDSWSLHGNGAGNPGSPGNLSAGYGIAADPASGDVFTGFSSVANAGEVPILGEVDKWLADGTPGTPAFFGDTFSAISNYGGAAIDPTTHDLYVLVDATPRSGGGSIDPKIAIFQPDGTLLDSFSVSTDKSVGIDVDASGSVYVPDPANGVVNEYDGALGSGSFGGVLDTTSGGSLHEPRDVALDASGNLYVADHATNSQDEHQTVDLQGNTGSFRLGFDGAQTGVDFTGDVSYVKGKGDLVRAQGTAERSLLGTVEGDLPNFGTTVKNLSNLTGTLSVGASIAGAGIEKGSTIVACSPDCSNPTELTLSKPTGGGFNHQTLTSGSKVLTNVTNVSQFAVGMGLVGSSSTTGIQFNNGFIADGFVTKITNVQVTDDKGTPDPSDDIGTLTLSDGVTSATSGSGTTIVGEYILNASTTEGVFEVGQKVKGPFNFGSFLAQITSVSGSTLVVADAIPPASGSTNASLEGASQTITNVHLSSGRFSPQLTLFADGFGGVPANTLVGEQPISVSHQLDGWDLAAHTLRVPFAGFKSSPPFSAGGTGISFHADLDTTGAAMLKALDALPSIAGEKYWDVGGFNLESRNRSIEELSSSGGPVLFEKAMGGRDLPSITCESGPALPLSGGTPDGECAVTTDQDGSNTPGKVAKFDSSLDFASDFIPPTTDYSALALAVDKTTGDVFVGGGNGDYANPQGALSGAHLPDFSVTRYDSSGNALGQVGTGTLTAAGYNNNLLLSSAFDLSYDSTAHKLYAVGRPPDPDYHTPDSVVNVFTRGHVLTAAPDGTGAGTVAADHGAIAGCDKDNNGTCAGDYADGDSVTLHAIPGILSGFVGWVVDGQPGACPGTGDCTVTTSADTTVHATFNTLQQSLTVVKDGGGVGAVTSTPVGIDCGSTCTAPFDKTSDVTLHAAATGASSFIGWTVTGQPGACPGTGDCVVTINADTTVHALFTQPQPLTVVKDGTGSGTVSSTPAGIACGATCGPVTFPEGSSVTLHAAPADAHQTFIGWTVTGQPGACPGTGDCTVTMNAATTVHATFTQNVQNLTVVREGTGSGKVTSTPSGIDCGSTCGPLAFNEASSVTLHAAPTPATHSAFVGWTVTGQPGACPGTGDCTVTMNAATTVHATFNLIHHDLTAHTSGNGHGTVDADFGNIAACSSGPPPSGTCTDSPIEGTPVTLTATAAGHSHFTGWTGCPSVTGNQCTVSVDADTNVTATFVLDKHSLSIAKSGSGSGSVTCDGGACAASYDYGATVSLAATASSSSHFTSWGGACSGAGSCTVTIDGDKSVSAGFDLDLIVQPPSCATDPSLCQVPKTPKCKRGFKKKKVHGKLKCVKVKKKKHKHHHR